MFKRYIIHNEKFISHPKVKTAFKLTLRGYNE
jgi:hypothetical protein